MSIEAFDIFLGNTVLIIEIIAAGVALISFSNYKHTPLKYFPILLVYTVVNEFIGGIGIFKTNNVVIYNIYNIIFFLFFLWVFWHFIANKRFKKWILGAVIIFMLTCIINPIFQNFIRESQLFTYLIGACTLLFCIILYYIEILSTSQVLIINQELLFWISVGLLLFYVGYIPIKLTRVFFEFHNNMYINLRIVHRLLIIILNGCFITGFLWMKKK